MEDKKLIAQLEKNTTALAKLNKEIEAAVGTQLAKQKELEAKNADIREAIKDAMEANGVTKFDGDLIAITYVAPTTRTTFDSKRFMAERPKTAEKYLKTSDVKSSIRIKLKV